MRAVYFTIVIILSVGCDSGIPLESPDSKSKYVVESYLASGDSVRVRVSQSYDYYTNPPYSGDGHPDTLFSYPAVSLLFNNVTYNLVRTYIENYPRPSTVYALPKSVFTVPSEGKLVLHVGETYTKDGVSAESILPRNITITSFKTFFEPKDITFGFLDTTIKGYRPARISISGNFYKGFYGLIQLQKYSPYYDRDIYISEIISNSSGNAELEVENEKLSFGTPDSSGVWTLTVYSIDKLYYDFYHALQSQKDGTADLGDLFVGDAIEIPSNIKGGLGIFTTMAVDTMSVVIP